MAMRESGEMYLETILILSKKLGTVRAIDVGESLGYSKPSVSRAMGILKKSGHITVDSIGSIKLTPSGRKVAEEIYERHTTLTELFKRLGVSEDVASDDACRIEHCISDETFSAVKRFLAGLQNCN